MKVGLIGQENDPKTANNEKFLDYLTNAEAASPPKTTANQDKEPAHSTTQTASRRIPQKNCVARLIGEDRVDEVPTKIILKSAVDNHVFIAGLMNLL